MVRINFYEFRSIRSGIWEAHLGGRKVALPSWPLVEGEAQSAADILLRDLQKREAQGLQASSQGDESASVAHFWIDAKPLPAIEACQN